MAKNHHTGSQTPEERVSYWKKRMQDAAVSVVRSFDPLEKDIRYSYTHVISIDQSRLDQAFGMIAQGCILLMEAIKDTPQKTKEGIVDLSTVRK